MHEQWRLFLKKERLRLLIFLSKKTNLFLEELVFIGHKQIIPTPYAVEQVLTFHHEKESTFHVTYLTAMNGQHYPGDLPPFETVSYFYDGHLFEVRATEEEILAQLFKLFLKETDFIQEN